MRPNPQETGDLATFTEEVLNGKLHFLCRGYFRIGKCQIEKWSKAVHYT